MFVIFLILQHMKRNHNHIVSYQSAIYHYNDVKHAKIPIKVSKSWWRIDD